MKIKPTGTPCAHGSRFTLIEVLFVIVIILLLVGLLVPVLTQSRAKSRYARWESTIRSQQNDDSLVLLYDFEALEETAGIIPNLASGLSIPEYNRPSYNGVLKSCQLVEGRWKTKGALKFIGISYIENTNIYGFPQLHEEFSAIVWCKFDDVTGTQNLITLSSEDDTFSWQMGVRNKLFTIWRAGGTPMAQDTTELETGKWYQFAYVYRDTKHWIYRNGNLVATGAGAPDFGPVTHLNIGRWADDSEFFTGIIDEVQVFNEALSDADVLGNYRMGEL